MTEKTKSKPSCELCDCMDNSAKSKSPIKWQHLTDDNTIDFYRCEEHGLDPDYDDMNGWENY